MGPYEDSFTKLFEQARREGDPDAQPELWGGEAPPLPLSAVEMGGVSHRLGAHARAFRVLSNDLHTEIVRTMQARPAALEAAVHGVPVIDTSGGPLDAEIVEAIRRAIRAVADELEVDVAAELSYVVPPVDGNPHDWITLCHGYEDALLAIAREVDRRVADATA